MTRRVWGMLLAVLMLLPAGCGTPAQFAGTWVAVQASPEPLVAGTRVTIIFDNSSTVTGSSGCNGYGSRNTKVSNGRLDMSQTAVTLMACAAPGVMEQEARFLALLNSTPEIRVDGDRLTLSDFTTTFTFVRS